MYVVGIGGPVGSGKTTLVEALVPRLLAIGRSVVVVTNDIVTREDERHVKAALAGILDTERIVGVETGACPHQAVREDPSMNIAALDELAARFPGTDYALVESGGDNLQLTFSADLVDHWLFVIDVAGGDKIPRKRGAGVVLADLLVVNKTDLAPHVGSDLGVIERDAGLVRGSAPTLFTDCRHATGLEDVVAHLEAARGGRLPRRGPTAAFLPPDEDARHDREHAGATHH
jgi:urease accessory protein